MKTFQLWPFLYPVFLIRSEIFWGCIKQHINETACPCRRWGHEFVGPGQWEPHPGGDGWCIPSECGRNATRGKQLGEELQGHRKQMDSIFGLLMKDRLYAEIFKDEKMRFCWCVLGCGWVVSLEDVVWQHHMNLENITMSKDPTPFKRSD